MSDKHKELICPHCNTPFQVDDNLYASILEQVRNATLNEEIERRTVELEKQFDTRLQNKEIAAEKEITERMAQKDSCIADLRQTIEQLNGKISSYEASKKAELAEMKAKQSEELARLNTAKDKKIADLQAQLDNSDAKHQLAIEKERSNYADELHRKDQSITQLSSQLEAAASASKNRELELKDHHAILLREKEEEISRLKDYKARLSTKMLGETLEQHCANTFAQMQSMGSFPYARFEKDNDISQSGTKGDFIFRDYEDGKEYVSIMFEMKNEADTTATKHRNTDFLDKLDRDRKSKGCEYAVLVTMLEQDNPVYDNGIVDMSHRYPKMLIIRPQFLMPLLRVLTEAAKHNLSEILTLREELSAAQEQSIDLTNLLTKIERGKNNFSKHLTTAQNKFEAAMDGIDTVIAALEKQINALRNVKANFGTSEQKLLKANEVLEDEFTIKKLTHGNPKMRAKLEEANRARALETPDATDAEE